MFDLGNGANLIKGSSNKPLNDNQWHNVMISRDTSNLHTVKIDTKITTQITAGARNLDLKSKYWLSHSVQLLYSVHEWQTLWQGTDLRLHSIQHLPTSDKPFDRVQAQAFTVYSICPKVANPLTGNRPRPSAKVDRNVGFLHMINNTTHESLFSFNVAWTYVFLITVQNATPKNACVIKI